MSPVKRIAISFVALAAAFAASTAFADVQRWTLQDMTFANVTNSLTGQVLSGGTVTGFFVYDTTKHELVTWNIVTSPGWATCNVPSAGNVCYTEGIRWTKGDSHVFTGAAFFQLLQGDQNTLPLLDIFLHQTTDPNVLALDTRNSAEIESDSPDTFRHIVTGSATLGTH